MVTPSELNTSSAAEGAQDLRKMGRYVFESYRGETSEVWADSYGVVQVSIEQMEVLMENMGFPLRHFYPHFTEEELNR